MNKLEITGAYLKDTMGFLEENEFFEDVSKEDGVEDIEKFKELFIYELEIKILDAYNTRNEPELTEEEFLDAAKISIIEYHLESLKDKGLVKSELDLETGEMMYSLVDKPIENESGFGMYDH